jgi:hypothetical protein
VESSRSEGGLVGVTLRKTNRPVQTGQGMIKDGSCEDATLCWRIRALQTQNMSIFGVIWPGVKDFLCAAHIASRYGTQKAALGPG